MLLRFKKFPGLQFGTIIIWEKLTPSRHRGQKFWQSRKGRRQSPVLLVNMPFLSFFLRCYFFIRSENVWPTKCRFFDPRQLIDDNCRFYRGTCLRAHRFWVGKIFEFFRVQRFKLNKWYPQSGIWKQRPWRCHFRCPSNIFPLPLRLHLPEKSVATAHAVAPVLNFARLLVAQKRWTTYFLFFKYIRNIIFHIFVYICIFVTDCV